MPRLRGLLSFMWRMAGSGLGVAHSQPMHSLFLGRNIDSITITPRGVMNSARILYSKGATDGRRGVGMSPKIVDVVMAIERLVRASSSLQGMFVSSRHGIALIHE